MSGKEVDTSRPRALIIASNHYQDPGLNMLRPPSREARELADTLADDTIGGFDVRVLLDEPSHVLRERIEDFFADRQRNDMMLLYISCHGVLDQRGELHFAASDTKLTRLSSTGMPAQFIQDQVENCRASRAILILDCCFSGAVARGHQPRREGRAELDSFERAGRVILTSSTALEYAFEATSGELDGSARGSVFTTALIDGLRTGEADRDRDGLVSVSELYSFLSDRIRAITPNQNPEMHGVLRGDFVIAKNPQMDRSELDRIGYLVARGQQVSAPDLDDPEGVLTYWSRVADALKEGSDRHQLAVALNRVGNAQIALGRAEDAVSPVEESAALCRDLGDRAGELAALAILSNVYRDLGYVEDAIIAERRAAELRKMKL